jgi:hypothetical protein
MKLPRFAQAGLVACVLAPIIAAAVPAVTASASSWEAKAEDARGDVFYAWGPTRAEASARAMRDCVRDSTYASNCSVDWASQN